MGSSQGGWCVLNLCVHEPDRVEAAALLAPAASLAPFSRMTVLSLRIPPPPWVARPALRALLGGDVELDERLPRVMASSFRHFRYQQRAVYPDMFGDTSLGRVTSPLLVMVGDREIIYEYELREVLARAARLIPHAHTELVPGAGHVLNLQMPELVNRRLLEFFSTARAEAKTSALSPGASRSG